MLNVSVTESTVRVDDADDPNPISPTATAAGVTTHKADPIRAAALLDAAARGDVDAVNKCADVPVTVTDARGWTPLHHASYNGHVAVTAVLIHDRGADPSIPTNNAKRATPLHFAAAGGRPAVVKLLLSAGANADAKDSRGTTPFDVATAGAAKDILAALRTSAAVVTGSPTATPVPTTPIIPSAEGSVPTSAPAPPARVAVPVTAESSGGSFGPPGSGVGKVDVLVDPQATVAANALDLGSEFQIVMMSRDYLKGCCVGHDFTVSSSTGALPTEIDDVVLPVLPKIGRPPSNALMVALFIPGINILALIIWLCGMSCDFCDLSPYSPKGATKALDRQRARTTFTGPRVVVSKIVRPRSRGDSFVITIESAGFASAMEKAHAAQEKERLRKRDAAEAANPQLKANRLQLEALHAVKKEVEHLRTDVRRADAHNQRLHRLRR